MRTGAFIGWTSLAMLGIGVAMHFVFQYNLSTGHWLALPPPAGFGTGAAGDPAAACVDDIRMFCPEARGLGSVMCLQQSLENLNPGCRAVLMSGARGANE